MRVADLITKSGKTITYCICYPSLGGGVITGKFNPSGGQLSFTATPEANNIVRTARYGKGFGFLVGNTTPDPDHANSGWVNEHNIPMPWSAAVVQALGLPASYSIDETDLSDMSACNDWVDQVLRPTIAAVGSGVTPQAATAAIASPAFQQAAADIGTALGKLAASIGVK